MLHKLLGRLRDEGTNVDLRGFGQSADNGGVAAGAIQRLLDGEDLRITGGLLDEIHDRTESLKRVMQQHIAGAQGCKDIATHLEPLGNARRE